MLSNNEQALLIATLELSAKNVAISQAILKLLVSVYSTHSIRPDVDHISVIEEEAKRLSEEHIRLATELERLQALQRAKGQNL